MAGAPNYRWLYAASLLATGFVPGIAPAQTTPEKAPKPKSQEAQPGDIIVTA